MEAGNPEPHQTASGSHWEPAAPRDPQVSSDLEGPNSDSSTSVKMRKPLSFHLAFVGIAINTFVFSLDATALAVAIPVSCSCS